MKFVLPCLLFLSFPGYAEVAAPAEEAPKAEGEARVEASSCSEEEPCELLRESAGAASRVEVITPSDAPEGYSEQIYILE